MWLTPIWYTVCNEISNGVMTCYIKIFCKVHFAQDKKRFPCKSHYLCVCTTYYKLVTWLDDYLSLVRCIVGLIMDTIRSSCWPLSIYKTINREKSTFLLIKCAVVHKPFNNVKHILIMMNFNQWYVNFSCT